MENCSNFGEIIPKVFEQIINDIAGTPDGTNGSMIGISFNHPDLNEPVLISFRPRNMIDGNVIFEQISNIIQSNAEVHFDDKNATLRIVKVTAPDGKGNHNRSGIFSLDDILNRKCIIRIKNADNMCLARAVVVALAYTEKSNDKTKWNAIRKDDKQRYKAQRVAAYSLMENAGLRDHTGPCGIPELTSIQCYLKHVQIKVFSKDLGHQIMFEGIDIDEIFFLFITMYKKTQILGAGPRPKTIYLYHHDANFDVITSMPAFFSRVYFCNSCNVAYNNQVDHRCSNKCPCCYSTPPCFQTVMLFCKHCNRYFRSSSCLEKHRAINKPLDSTEDANTLNRATSICDRIQRCKKCNKHIQRAHRKIHKCGYFECRTCKREVKKDGKFFSTLNTL